MKMLLQHPYLTFTGSKHQPFVNIHIYQEENLIQEACAQLGNIEAADCHTYFVNMTEFIGQEVDIRIELSHNPYIPEPQIELTNDKAESLYAFIKNEPDYTDKPHYNETNRPLVHFTTQRGWINDPNGLVYADGVFHLGYQYAPGSEIALWISQWGHATSTDLLNWKEQEPIVRTKANSGGGWINAENGKLCICHDNLILESDDNGYHYHVFHSLPFGIWGDPKIFYHKESENYISVAQMPEEGNPHFNTVIFSTSPDMIHWTQEGTLKGYHECPDFFYLPVEGTNTRKWILSSADGAYRMGSFDGHMFVEDSVETDRIDVMAQFHSAEELFFRDKYNSYFPHNGLNPGWERLAAYAFQCFQNSPDGRTIRLGWLTVYYPDEPFSQGLIMPQELTLRETGFGLRICSQPIREIANYYQKTVCDSKAVSMEGKAFDCTIDFLPQQIVRIWDHRFVYDAKHATIHITLPDSSKMTVPFILPASGNIHLRAVFDIGCAEFYLGLGEVYTALRFNNFQCSQITAHVDGDGDSHIIIHRLCRAMGTE